ncbi:hypothetical protein M0802_000261 [Mischocyttarus mexicanus]|nr:hypothetical protein M0802_000261 [Mischocyttarus mexicanus]
MWSTRCYASISNAKQIIVIKNKVLRYLSQSVNIAGHHKETENVNNSINPKVSCSTISSKLEERGYVDKTLNSENEVTKLPVQNLQETQSNSSDLTQKIITNVDDLSLYDKYIKVPEPLDECNEDVSYVGSYQLPSYNIAKYANSSETIQRLMKLGVELYKYESNVELMEFLLSKDFDKDLFPYIRFLHDCGVPGDYLGKFFTKNLYLFKIDIDDLHTRIRYLRFHRFNINMIKKIICYNPKWLNYSTKSIDTKLGYFQTTFNLSGKEVRQLTTKNSKLITYKTSHIIENTFAIKEIMGFNRYEMKNLLLNQSKIWMKCKNFLQCQLTQSIPVIHSRVLLEYLSAKIKLETFFIFLFLLILVKFCGKKTWDTLYKCADQIYSIDYLVTQNYNYLLYFQVKKNILSTFDYAHNEMKLSHELISSQSYVLLCRKCRLEQRHKFLVKLGRAQYDPTKPMYVSLIALIGGTDEEFCQNVAKTSTETYDLHLKSI